MGNVTNSQSSLALKISASAVALVAAVFMGLLGATAGWMGQIVLVSILLPTVILVINYRFALLLLILILPFADAQFWPKVGPLSIVNLLLLGVVGMHLLHQFLDSMRGKRLKIPFPKEFILLYWLPLTLGFAIGSLHLHEIPAYAIDLSEAVGSQRYYWVTLYFKGILFPIAAFVLAACIVDQRSGRRVVYISLASGVAFVTVGFLGWIESGISLENAVRARLMFRFAGKDPNIVGFLLLPLIGVSIYLWSITFGVVSRIILFFVTVTLVAGLLITGSRAGFLGLVFLFAYAAVSSRNFRTLLFLLLLAIGAFFLLPDAVVGRLTMGVDEAIQHRAIDVKGDQLTSGRWHVYGRLVQDMISNPLFGGGITSTRWSELVKGGYWLMHPHSMYISLLLDLGILGTLAMIAFAVIFFKWWGKLAESEDIDPVMRKYYLGLRAGFVGYLGCALGTGDAYPATQQWFLWIGIAMAFRYRSFLPAEKVTSTVRVSNSLQ